MEQIHIHWSKRQHQITTGNKRNKEFTSLTNTVSNGFVFWVSGSYGLICSADASEVLTSSIMFVSIQTHIFCKLNVLLSLNGSALFRPRQSLQMDAEALRQLKVKIKHTHTHARMHTRTHARTHAHRNTNKRILMSVNCQCLEKCAGLNERITIMSTFPSFSCLTNVVLWLSRTSPFTSSPACCYKETERISSVMLRNRSK